MSHPISELQAHVRELVNRGNHLIGRGNLPLAATALSEARRLAKEGGFEDEQLQSSISLSYCHLFMGDRARAAELLEEAYQVATRIGNPSGQGKCRLNLGVLLKDSDPGKALDHFREAADLFEKAGDSKGAGQALDNIGILYNSMGLLRQSIHFMIRAGDMFERCGDVQEWGICQRAIGNLLTDMADAGFEDPTEARKRARECYDKSSAALARAGARLELAKTQDAIGLLLQSEGRLDEAIRVHESVVEVFQQPGCQPWLSSALLHLGAALQRQGRSEEALETFRHARRIKESLGDRAGLANLDHNEAEADMSLGRFADARALYSAALAEKIESVESLRDEEMRVRLEEQIYRTWSGYLYASVKDCLSDPGPARLDVLLSDLERSKARTLKRQIAGGLSGAPDMPESELAPLREEIECRRWISEASDERIYLRSQRSSGAISPEEYDRRMLPVSDKVREIFFRMESLRRRAAGETGKDLLDLLDEPDVLAELAGVKAVFMIDFLSKWEVAFLSLDGKGASNLSLVSLTEPERKSLGGWFERPERGWRAWLSRLPELAGRLGDLLSRADVQGSIGDGDGPLLWVPHGPLHLLPWEIARWQDSHLGLEQRVVRHYSASLQRLVRSRSRAGLGPAPLRSVIFAPEPEELPGSLKEAEELARVFHSCGVEAEVVLGKRATREAFLEKLNCDAVPLVHFSGHCGFDRADSALSALALRSGSREPDDHLLTALEMQRRLRMDALCVYLNCCDSGMAEMRSGDDALGLVRSFLLAGAVNLVLSGWPVLDESAPDLAAELYRRFLAGHSIPEALRQARRRVHADAVGGRYKVSAPLEHWGPFALYGDFSRSSAEPRAA